ncbi:MAG: translation elongation factor Ts [Actinomycetia bacterium]|nr:translation elongation factor Ts [Actinomycetes bacterium]MCP4962509.1 translation elongation factor Ts [Actinomycetes bacterium]
MADFSAKDVQRLRQQSGAGMMDAKKALVENDGDFEAAAAWLREKGLAKASSRSDRENTEGVVAAKVDGSVAAAVELKCETDFVAKSDQFIAMADEILGLVLSDGVDAAAAKSTAIDDMRVTLKENIELGRVVRFEANEGQAIDAYVHIQNGRGVNAVLVHLSQGTTDTARDVAMHAAFSRPGFVSRDEVPEDEVAAERETLANITRNEGKPEQAIDKIVEGRLTGWFKERVLLDQGWVKDDKMSVAKMLGDAEILGFAQIEIGS